MAIAKAFDENIYISDISFEIEDFAIGGKLIKTTISIPEIEYLMRKDDTTWKEFVRERLVREFVDKILAGKFVEVTTQQDPISHMQLVHAYFYLAPNDQIKVLRTMKR